MRGGSGVNRVAFLVGDGIDTIYDFDNGFELIDFSATTLAFGDLTIGDDGNGNATVDFGASDQIIVPGAAGNIEQSDFVFATV